MTERTTAIEKGFASEPSSWDELVSVGDVTDGYGLFLGRDPESSEVVQQLAGLARWQMIAAFVTSSELQEKLGPIEFARVTAVDPALLAPVNERLMAAGRALTDRHRWTSVTRLSILAELLRDERLLARMEKSDQSFGYRALAAALDNTMADARIVRQSPLFVDTFYQMQVGDGRAADLAEHYLLAGEHMFLRPSSQFDPLRYGLDNQDATQSHANLLLHYEQVGRAQGRPLSTNASEGIEEHHIEILRTSELYDEQFYLAQLGKESARIKDAARHYVMVGEACGYAPSASFDPVVYADLHPDVAASNINRLLHYLLHGRHEGRSHRSYVDDLNLAADGLDPEKPTILLLLHEATHTGAPILGWNLLPHLRRTANVVTVVRDGGSLDTALHAASSTLVGPLAREVGRDPAQLTQLARRLKHVFRPIYVVANSFESRMMALALRDCGVPIIALVHEFAMAQRPGIRSDYYKRCSAIVFPAELVRASAARAYREIGLQNTFIFPQGQSEVPPFARQTGVTRSGLPGLIMEEDGDVPPSLSALLEQKVDGRRPFTIVGLGTAEPRKGIDLFVSTASALARIAPSLAVRFIWIGDWQHVASTPYGDLLVEQINRSNLHDRLHLFSATDDLNAVYDNTDVLFLSSRLDPLPNVSIDAAMRSIPIVCFAQASGMAELMAACADTASLVVPYLDTGSAAERILALATNSDLYQQCREAVRSLALRTFDMAQYARRIEEVGAAAAAKFAMLPDEAATIAAADALDEVLFFGKASPKRDSVVTATRYLDETRQINFASAPVWGVGLTRPMAGFHPFIYGTEAPDFPPDGSCDPLAHFIARGRPAGRWSHPVIRLEPMPRATPSSGRRGLLARLVKGKRSSATKPLRVALHGHFHYTDNIGDFMEALSANRTAMDLFLTTTSNAASVILKKGTAAYRGGKVTISTFPNVGRDIYPFTKILRDSVAGNYDWVGHVHGKRSVHTLGFDKSLGDRWRTFLWEHLIGPSYPAADAIIDLAAADPTLGLVFPENDITVAWEKNAEVGYGLAERLDLPLPLPAHIEFPVGTMFWARPEALTKLTSMNLTPADYPPEPLPIDGTLLHALERLLPLICEHAGYRYATTYIPEIRR